MVLEELSKMSSPILDLGIVGLVLMVLWKFLDVAKLWWLTKNGRGDVLALDRKLPCLYDPSYFERMKNIEENSEHSAHHAIDNKDTMRRIRDGIADGAFGCSWKDRDEVINMINAIHDNTKAQRYVEAALKELTVEIRKSNGRS